GAARREQRPRLGDGRPGRRRGRRDARPDHRVSDGRGGGSSGGNFCGYRAAAGPAAPTRTCHGRHFLFLEAALPTPTSATKDNKKGWRLARSGRKRPSHARSDDHFSNDHPCRVLVGRRRPG
ncbi:hypothetical protein OC834_007941, partial [Tilletia horrida]